MKKVMVLGVLLLTLTGCTGQTVETVSDIYVEQIPAAAKQLVLDLPEEAAQPVMESSTGEKLYLCDGYEVRVATLRSGDLSAVLEEMTGFTREQLTVIETAAGQYSRYDSTWCTAGEEGEQVGRTAVLDDGSYCYCVTALAKSDHVRSLRQEWQQVFSSLELRQY